MSKMRWGGKEFRKEGAGEFEPKEKGYSTIGFSSIVVIFVMLALTTFTVLALVSANSDYKLTKKVASRNTEYYEAENLANNTLSELDLLLHHIYEEQGNLSYQAISSIMDDGQEIVCKQVEGGTEISYSYSIDTISDFEVTLFVAEQPAGNSLYEITQWQMVNTSDEGSSTEGSGADGGTTLSDDDNGIHLLGE